MRGYVDVNYLSAKISGQTIVKLLDSVLERSYGYIFKQNFIGIILLVFVK